MTDNEILQMITEGQTPDYQFVCRLATEHNADLHSWCRRRRTTQRIVTSATVAVSLIVLIVVAFLPDPDGHYVSSAQARAATINTIEQTTLIAKL